MPVRAALAPALALLLCAVLAACATTPPPPAPRPAPAPAPSPPPAPPSRPLSWSDLPGWADEDHLGALQALQAACRANRDAALRPACARLRAETPADRASARRFLEANFQPERIAGEGLLTAYFAPVYEGRLAPEPPFSAPVRPRPPGEPAADGAPLPERAVIDGWPTADALAWMRAEDLFFLQLQGSGVLVLPDGRRLKAAYAASNGQPYVGLARVMIQDGLLDASKASGDAIRAWLADHRGPEADAVIRRNPRYAFFTVKPDDGQEPAGAAGIPLPAGRAGAVDPTFNALGSLFWIDASAPTLAGAFPAYRRLVAALDTGAAIKGAVRVDLYMGSGEAAGTEAGRVRHDLRLFRLVPRPVPAP